MPGKVNALPRILVTNFILWVTTSSSVFAVDLGQLCLNQPELKPSVAVALDSFPAVLSPSPDSCLLPEERSDERRV